MNELIQHFNQLIARGNLNHAYLFSGNNIEGKRQVTQQLIQSLACPNFQEASESCNQCDYCRRILADEIPDILYLQAEGQAVRVSQIRDLKEWLNTSPLELHFKMVIIEEADLLNASSANALLTMLEEPNDNIYLILWSQNTDNILPTIRSRLQEIHFVNQLQTDYVNALVEQGIERAHAEILAFLPTASMDRISQDYQAESIQAWFKQLNYFWILLVSRDKRAFVSVQTHLKEYLTLNQAQDSLDYLLVLSHHALLRLIQSESATTKVHQYFLDNIMAKTSLSQSQLIHLYDAILVCKQRITANVSSQLAFEALSLAAIQFK